MAYEVIPPSLRLLARRLDEAASGRDDAHMPPSRGRRPAAVLILLSSDPDPDVVLIERAVDMRAHSGQIAFPGGAIDPDDESPIAAALREAEEEAGVPPTEVTVLGTLPPAHVAVSGFEVTGVIGWWYGLQALSAIDVAEVASVHRLGLAALADPEVRRTALHSSGFRGPAFVMGELFIWGFTAHVLDTVLELGGWSRDWDRSRESEIPERFSRRGRTYG